MSRMNRFCPVCGTRASTLLYSNKMAPLGGIDLSYDVVGCTACGVTRATNMASADEYAQYYSQYSKYETAGDPPKAQREYYDFVVNLSSEFILAHQPIFDIGCGCGFLLRGFGLKNPERIMFGIDPAPKAAQKLLEPFPNARVKKGFLEDVGNLVVPEGALVCMSCVLEHLLDPCSAINMCHSIMENGAFLCLALPCLDLFDGNNKEPFGEFSLEHINYFSKASLTALIGRAGFEVVEIRELDLKVGGIQAVIAKKTAKNNANPMYFDDSLIMTNYIAHSKERFKAFVLKEILNSVDSDFFIFGAGSHTARMLPQLEDDVLSRCVGIIDNNTNLHGSNLGPLKIMPVQSFSPERAKTIVFSSFLSELAMKQQFARLWPDIKMVTLYQPH